MKGEWTKEYPREDGIYWVKDDLNSDPYICDWCFSYKTFSDFEWNEDCIEPDVYFWSERVLPPSK